MQHSKTFSESTGLILRKIANCIWFLFPIVMICLAVIITNVILNQAATDIQPLKIVSVDCSITEYYKYTDVTQCDLEITFDQPVLAGKITIAFYDKKGQILDTQSPIFFGGTNSAIDTTLRSSSVFVNGKFDSYKIIDYSDIKSVSKSQYMGLAHNMKTTVFWILFIWIIVRCIYVIPLVLSALFFSCKTYRIGKHMIVVYAGRTKHYIKIDGRKYDEKNALISFSAITLNATLDSGEKIDVYISSFTKRISLRVNGVLETPTTL